MWGIKLRNSNRFSNGTKAILIILEEIFAVIMCVCLVMGFVFMDQRSLSDQLFQKSLKYEDSRSFTNIVQEKLDESVKYGKLRSSFETQGEYDGKKLVDIAEYDKDSIISGKQSISVAYYLEDLIKWSQVGLEYEYLDSDGREPKISLTEEYLPARGRHLFDYCSEKLDKETLLSHLENTLSKIGDNYQQYKELKSYFDKEKSNLRFYIEDYDNDAVYTNINIPDYRENYTIKAYGRYMILDSVNLEYESNMAVSESYLYNLLGSYASDFSGDYYIEIGIDTSYPVIDDISEDSEVYYNYLPGVKGLMFGGVASGIMSLLLLIILTLQAGYKKEPDGEDRLTLLGFDKIKTELAAGGMFFVAFVILLVFANPIAQSGDLFRGIYTAIAAALLNAFFLLGYMSLVRRIKAGTMWSNSLCAWFFERLSYIGRACRTIYNSRRVTTRVILAICSFILINWIFIAAGAKNQNKGLDIFELCIVAFDIFILVLLVNQAIARNKVLQGVKIMCDGDLAHKIDISKMSGETLEMAEAINHMGEGLQTAVEASIKNERLKADLITNVSHDIKTPLTSIINYVDLLKREDIQNEKVLSYIEVLEKKSQRLKHLTEDLVEASKISSGNITLNIERINFIELIHQTAGELSEKFESRNLTLITSLPDVPVAVAADGRRLYRVLENLYNNVAKYALENTRVYADLVVKDGRAEFSIKNISSQPLNINANELTERFIRGDVSRSTEGSGLGLSIAKSLTEAQNGVFTIYLDGDLFKVIISFDKLP